MEDILQRYAGCDEATKSFTIILEYKEKPYMFDLQQKFETIIKKLPDFGSSLEIENKIGMCIRNMVDRFSGSSKIIIRGGGKHTKQLLTAIKEQNGKESFSIVAIVDDGMQGENIDGIHVISRTAVDALDYDVIILSSFSYAKEMRMDYDEAKIEIWDLYSELAECGYYLTAPFYYYQEGNYEIPLYYKQAYELVQTKENLESLIDSLLVLKDFKTAFYYIEEYISLGFDIDAIYQRLQQDLENMFIEAKAKMQDRDGKDIVMFWIDAVPYMQLHWLPYIYAKKEKCCFFERAYTVTPYTHPTMHSLLQGVLRIEDYSITNEEIDESNSEIIQDLQKAGYDFLYIGYCGNKHLAEKFRIENSSVEHEVGKMTSACKIYWELLCRLLKNHKPLYCIAHSVVETHEPYIALSLGKKHSYKLSEIMNSGQHKKSYKYLNEQLEFYSRFLPDDMTKIYMSDHGDVFSVDTWKFTEERVHPFFLIESEKVPAKKVSGIFSYVNFKWIVKCLLNNQEKYLLQATTKYALIEDVDKYNVNVINFLTKNNIEEYGFSFRGTVTSKDKYVKLSTGKEFYFQLSDESKNLIHDERFSKRIAILSDITGDKFLDVNEYPEFVHSRKLYSKK